MSWPMTASSLRAQIMIAWRPGSACGNRLLRLRKETSIKIN
jgi:hypothetical protein